MNRGDAEAQSGRIEKILAQRRKAAKIFLTISAGMRHS
jgi:hypothetical protein